MRLTQDRRTSARTVSVSLILTIEPGSTLAEHAVAECRRVLEEEGGFHSIEVIIVRGADDTSRNGQSEHSEYDDELGDLTTYVATEAADWPGLVRAGLRVATGDHLVVLDVNRHYSTQSLLQVLAPLRTGRVDLAIAVPRHGRSSLADRVRSLSGTGHVSRLMLGTSDVFSGLFALRRVDWHSDVRPGPPHGSSLVLDSMLRRHARSVDVPVLVGQHFKTGHLSFKDLRPLKGILDGRFGNYSRLVQFCIVGASGMVIDLSFYALFQFLLSFAWWTERKSALFGGSWQLALAAAMSIAIALVWNFALNRRLTFNDAHKGALLRQFFTYVVSNALAIVLSFSVRLYLPAHIGFFARHRLAAAVVGIVAATGISFSMARWLVFARQPDLARTGHGPLKTSALAQPAAGP